MNKQGEKLGNTRLARQNREQIVVKNRAGMDGLFIDGQIR